MRVGSLLETSRELTIHSTAPTGLLVSVRSDAEAQSAILGGADWIDLKEPLDGTLSPVSPTIANVISKNVGGRRPLSAALGELIDWPNATSQGILAVPNIYYVKLGLAGMIDIDEWKTRWKVVEEQAADAGKRLVAVAYADWQRARAPSPTEVLALAEESQAKVMLIDTYNKRFPGTLEQLGAAELRNFATAAKRKQIAVIVAGKIGQREIRDLPLEDFNLVAVRGAVCQEDRTSRVSRILVAQFKHELVDLLPNKEDLNLSGKESNELHAN